jgi:predicted AAA+ superfamily ATPase
LDLTDQQTSIDLVRYRLYIEYMDRQLPQLALDSSNSKKHITELVDKVINYDIARLHNITDTQIIYSIFKIICKSPGEIIKYEDLATMFGVTAQTIKLYLKYLEDALLVRKLYNYQTNARKSERSKKRYYPYFTTLHLFAYPHIIEFGRKIETEVAFQLKPQFFWNRLNQEIDFVLNSEENIAIEVKMRKNIRRNDLKWLIQATFCKSKYVITDSEFKTNFEIEALNLIFVPIHQVSEFFKKE